MATDLRKTGIDVISQMPWGTHFCLFYETKGDLLDTLVPYFKAGLEGNEFCVWVVADPVTEEDAWRALSQAVPALEGHRSNQSIEVLPARDWYLNVGHFELERVTNAWNRKLTQALARGYAGMRVSGDTLWLEKKTWQSFLEYENQLDESITDQLMTVLCTYQLTSSGAAEILDVARSHQFALARRGGTWEVIETPELKQAKAEIKRLNEQLERRVAERTTELAAANEQLKLEIIERKQTEALLHTREQEFRAFVENAPDHIIRYDKEFRRAYVNPAVSAAYGLPKEAFIGKPVGSIVEDAGLKTAIDQVTAIRRQIKSVFDTGQATEFEVTFPSPGEKRTYWTRMYPEFDPNGMIINVLAISRDITDRKQAEEEIRRHAARMEALAEISQALAEVGLDVRAVFETIVRHTAELIGDTCAIRLLSSDEQWLESVAFHNPNPEVKSLMRLLHPTTPTSANHSWLGPVLRTGQPLLIPIITQEQLRRSVQPEYLPFFEQVGLHSMLIVPVRVKGRVIGTLGLSRDQPGHPYTLDDQVLLQDLADRASLTIQNAQLFEQVQGAHQRLKILSSRLVEVQESERKRLAREIHDEFGQSLTALKMDLAWLHGHLPPRSKGLREKVDSALDLTNETIQMTQRLASQLRPRMLDDLGLAAALEWHVNEWRKHTRIKTKVNFPEEEWELNPSLNTGLYRVCQEALTNVARHAGASKVEVSLAREGDEVVLTVRDNGRGMDEGKITAPESLGLLGMKERVEQIGGRLEVQSEAGKGTTVVARVLPVSQSSSLQPSHSSLKERGQAGRIPKRRGSHKRKP